MARDWNRFQERFETNEETGVWKLTAIGCMERFKVPRDEMMMTNYENKVRSLDTLRKEDWNEAMLQNRVAYLIQRGLKPLPYETLEEFAGREV